MSTSVPGIGSSGPRAKPSSGDVLEQPVDRRRRRARDLGQPARRLAGRRAQAHGALLRVQEVDERAHRHRLAGARAAGEDRQPALEHGAHHRPLGVGGGEARRSGARSRPGAGAARRRCSSRTWRASRVSTPCMTRVEDAVALDHQPAAGGELVDAVVGVGAEQAAARARPARRGGGGSGRRSRPRAARGAARRRGAPGSPAGVPSAWASASAVAKPMPSSSVRP